MATETQSQDIIEALPPPANDDPKAAESPQNEPMIIKIVEAHNQSYPSNVVHAAKGIKAEVKKKKKIQPQKLSLKKNRPAVSSEQASTSGVNNLNHPLAKNNR